jgi:tetratricopeptide (TPR) repeat protein
VKNGSFTRGESRADTSSADVFSKNVSAATGALPPRETIVNARGKSVICDHESGFLATVGPLIARHDTEGLLRLLAENWPTTRLIDLLSSDLPDVVRLAATCLGASGGPAHGRYASHLLAHDDPAVVAAAEDALWNIWMRSASDAARDELAVAIAEIRDDHTAAACQRLARLCELEPAYSEAHHQRGIALHAAGRLDEAYAAYGTAVALNSHHFAAMAAMGHICVELGDYVTALRHYRDAVSIHPHIADLPELLPQLESLVRRRSVA